jgi:hypothetical protein
MRLTGRTKAIGLVLLIAPGLAACAETAWFKAGVTSARRDADLASCEAYARQETEEDFVSRIEETSRGVVAGTDALHSRDDLRRLDVYDRRTTLTEACMRQLGYTEVEQGAADATEAPEVEGDEL